MVGITGSLVVAGLEVAVRRLRPRLRRLVVLVVLHDHLGRRERPVLTELTLDDRARTLAEGARGSHRRVDRDLGIAIGDGKREVGGRSRDAAGNDLAAEPHGLADARFASREQLGRSQVVDERGADAAEREIADDHEDDGDQHEHAPWPARRREDRLGGRGDRHRPSSSGCCTARRRRQRLRVYSARPPTITP
jgi:hypothetical protein